MFVVCRVYNPSKLQDRGQVIELVQAFEGREAELNSALMKQYQQDLTTFTAPTAAPAAPAPAAPAAAASPVPVVVESAPLTPAAPTSEAAAASAVAVENVAEPVAAAASLEERLVAFYGWVRLCLFIVTSIVLLDCCV